MGDVKFEGRDALAPDTGGSRRDCGQVAFGGRALVSGVAAWGFYQILWPPVRIGLQIRSLLSGIIWKGRIWAGVDPRKFASFVVNQTRFWTGLG